jgi:hypothetical protein
VLQLMLHKGLPPFFRTGACILRISEVNDTIIFFTIFKLPLQRMKQETYANQSTDENSFFKLRLNKNLLRQ